MVIIGILKVYLNKLTTLSFKMDSVKEKNIAQEGWICPRYGKVNAPWVMQCSTIHIQNELVLALKVLED